MTWWYLENLIDESTLAAPCKHVLKTLCRQINPPDAWDKHDPDAWDPVTHPEALMVWYDRVKLSLLTSYSPDSLRRIVGQLGPPPDDDDPRRKKKAGLTYYAVLYEEVEPHQWYTALLRIDLAALRALHDPRLDALEAERHKTREARQQRRRRRAPGHQGTISTAELNGHHLAESPAAEVSQGTYLTPTESSEAVTQGTYLTPSDDPGDVKYAGSASRGRILRPPFSSSSSPSENPSPIFSGPESAPTSSEKKEEGPSRTKTKPKTKTPVPDTLDLTDELRAWVHAHARQVDLVFERKKFLQHCRAHETENVNWIEAFKLWLLEANRRATRHGHRPGSGPDPVVAQLRATRASEAPVDPPRDLVPPPTPAAEADSPEWIRYQDATPFHVGGCRTHHLEWTVCPELPGQAHEATLPTPHPLGTDRGPPPEASAFHQRQVVQTAEEHGFIGLGELVAAVARNGNGYHHTAPEDPG